MCGRIGRPDLTWRQLYELQRGFLGEPTRIDGADELTMSWNVKPTQSIDIAFISNGELFSTPARWWFVPHWFRGDVKEWKQTTFNSRIESADSKPTFRTAWSQHRCVIPVSGYYEWTGEKGSKQPWWITAQSNAHCMWFAGLYSRLGSGLHTCTIITRSALPQISHIHARTPIILNQSELSDWMNGSISTIEAQNALGTGWEGRMQYHAIKPFGRDDDGAELIDEVQISG